MACAESSLVEHSLAKRGGKWGGAEIFLNQDCKYCNLSNYVAYFVSNYVA